MACPPPRLDRAQRLAAAALDNLDAAPVDLAAREVLVDVAAAECAA